MLRIFGQMAGPNELKFVVDTHGLPGGGLDKKTSVLYILAEVPDVARGT